MLTRFKGLCQRVRQNNGITEVLITRRAQYSDDWSQEEHALLNLRSGPDVIFKEGDQFWVEVRPANGKPTIVKPTSAR